MYIPNWKVWYRGPLYVSSESSDSEYDTPSNTKWQMVILFLQIADLTGENTVTPKQQKTNMTHYQNTIT